MGLRLGKEKKKKKEKKTGSGKGKGKGRESEKKKKKKLLKTRLGFAGSKSRYKPERRQPGGRSRYYFVGGSGLWSSRDSPDGVDKYSYQCIPYFVGEYRVFTSLIRVSLLIE